VKLPITKDEMLEMVNTFLIENGFPADNGHREYVGAYISTIPQRNDEFFEHDALAFVRRAIAGELAFALLVAPAQRDRRDRERERLKAEQAAKPAGAPEALEQKT
jgi:hypothetical protein